MREYRYYLAAGRSLEVCDQIGAERLAGWGAAKAIMHEVGAEKCYGEPRILGFSFPNGVRPNGWRSYVPRYSHCLMPEKRNKAFASLRARIEAIRIPDAQILNSRLGLDWCFTDETAKGGGHGQVILFAVFETIGDKTIIRVPVDREGKHGSPPDAELLKTSTYWALKEAVEEKGTHPVSTVVG